MPRTESATKQPASAPRSRKGEATRARLIGAARHVFEQSGFLEARITDIAQEAGISQGSFYHYFDSKEQIFREVAEMQEEALTAPPTDEEGATDGPPATEYERILRANRLYLQRYRDNSKIMGVIEEVSRYDDPVNEARMRRQKHFADRAETAITRLQAEGAADKDVDAEIAAVALGAMVGRFAELWLVKDWAPYDFDRAVEQMTRLWANSIGVETPPVKKARRKKA